MTSGRATAPAFYITNYYEVDESPGPIATTTKYYYVGAECVAKQSRGAGTYLYSDHLGSMSLTRDPNGTLARPWYYPGACPEQSEGAARG